MSPLGELLEGAVREDVQRLGGVGFADARYGAVRGRVSRRRAARAAGAGGASVLGVGVLAVGAAQVPWNGLVFGVSASSPSVACVTSTPDAVAGSALTVPEGATFAIIDNASGAMFFAGLVDGLPASWSADGSLVSMERVTNKSASLALPSGATVLLEADDVDAGFSMVASDDSEVAIKGAHEYAAQVAVGDNSGSNIAVEPDPRTQTAPFAGFSVISVGDADWQVAQDGVTLATAHREGNTVTFTFANGEVKEFDIEGVRRLTVEMPDGTEAIFRVDGGVLTYEGSLVVPVAPAGQTATVTCVTTTPSPEPSDSSTPTATPSTSASDQPTPLATPNPAWSWNPEVPEVSPFQCGFVFARDQFGTDALQVAGARTTASDIRATFSDWYGNQAPTTEVADSDSEAYRAALEQADVRGATSTLDPASPERIQVSRDYDMPSLGFTFVAVSDGRVVGTVVPGSAGETPGVVVDSAGEGLPEEAFLWDLDALSPCGAASIDGAEIYAVAGFGQEGDFAYSWMRLAD